jgi:hypothetical protein
MSDKAEVQERNGIRSSTASARGAASFDGNSERMKMKHSKLVMMVLMVVGLCLPAGRAASDKSQTSDHQGIYTLVTIDGNKLPYAPPHEGGAPQILVLAGTITLNADGTFASAMTYDLPAGVTSQQFSGTYTRDGSRFSLRWKGAGTSAATLEGSTFTMDNEGSLFAYRK